MMKSSDAGVVSERLNIIKIYAQVESLESSNCDFALRNGRIHEDVEYLGRRAIFRKNRIFQFQTD